MTSAAGEQVVLIVTFDPAPGRREEFRTHLYRLVAAMAGEPHFVNTIVHDDLDVPDRLVLYEIWLGSRERWQRDEPPKPYRRAYEEGLPGLLANRAVAWMSPVAEWGSNLTRQREEIT
jgi:quinol monooxygenase YgiN